jgi:hypothetical protein
MRIDPNFRRCTDSGTGFQRAGTRKGGSNTGDAYKLFRIPFLETVQIMGGWKTLGDNPRAPSRYNEIVRSTG